MEGKCGGLPLGIPILPVDARPSGAGCGAHPFKQTARGGKYLESARCRVVAQRRGGGGREAVGAADPGRFHSPLGLLTNIESEPSRGCHGSVRWDGGWWSARRCHPTRCKTRSKVSRSQFLGAWCWAWVSGRRTTKEDGGKDGRAERHAGCGAGEAEHVPNREAATFGALRGVPARRGRAARRRSKPEGKAFPTKASTPSFRSSSSF